MIHSPWLQLPGHFACELCLPIDILLYHIMPELFMSFFVRNRARELQKSGQISVVSRPPETKAKRSTERDRLDIIESGE